MTSVGSVRLRTRRDAPDRIPNIIGDKQGVALIECDADRAAQSFALGIDKARQHVSQFGSQITALALSLTAVCTWMRRHHRSACSWQCASWHSSA